MQRESFALSILLIIILVSSNVCNISSQNINKSLAQLQIISSLKTYNFARDWGRHGTGDGQFGQYNSPNSIAVDSHGNVYVTDYDNNRVQKFDTNGNFITKWGSEGSKDGQFDGPKGIAVDTHGNVYVTDEGNTRIELFVPTINSSDTNKNNI